MQEFPKISIVIVNYDQAPYLEECIRSVVEQDYPNFEVFLVDGGSQDGSLEIIKKYENQLDGWVSEPDEGQYDGVRKGFDLCSGEIMAWINSDDRYHSGAFRTVAEIFSRFSQVHWLMGFPTEYTEFGGTINRIRLPWARWSRRRYLTYDFQFIQQESTFWRRSLWEKAGKGPHGDFSLAGDLELWARFFRHEKLYTTTALLGGFRYRGGDQRSRTQMGEYLSQAKQIIRRERGQLPFLKRLGLTWLRWWGLPWGGFHYFGFPLLKHVYPLLYQLPPVIFYDFEAQTFTMKGRLVEHPPLYFSGRQVSLKK